MFRARPLICQCLIPFVNLFWLSVSGMIFAVKWWFCEKLFFCCAIVLHFSALIIIVKINVLSNWDFFIIDMIIYITHS